MGKDCINPLPGSHNNCRLLPLMQTLWTTFRSSLIRVHSVCFHDKQDNSTNLYPPTKGYLRETCKSQNINPIYLKLKFTFGIIQIITNDCQVCLVLSLIKNTYIYTISISDLSTQPQRSRVCVNSKGYLACRYTLRPV